MPSSRSRPSRRADVASILCGPSGVRAFELRVPRASSVGVRADDLTLCLVCLEGEGTLAERHPTAVSSGFMAVRLPRWSGQIITGAADVRLIAFAWPDSAIAALGPLAVGLTAPRTLYGRSSVELAWRAAGELRGGDRYSPNAIELFATGVAIGLARSLLHGPRGEPALAARVRRRIEQDPSSELSLARLAREFGCTPSHLGRTFLRTYGMSPTEFRIRLRVEAARSLLATTSRPISELARTLGFHDASHFARHFRRLSGQSPLAFRTRQRHAASVPKQARSYRTESPDAP